jgi:2'-5' RNA ligase
MTDLFFIALLPPKEIADKIIALQKEVAEKFDCRHALKSPPHITLVPPFRCNDELEKVIIEPLRDFFSQTASFEIQLHGFSCFERNRVIFIDLVRNGHLEKIYFDLQNFADDNIPVKLHEKHAQFTPHITIASRDLRKEMFREAWSEFRERAFEGAFDSSSAWLLRHSGTEWVPSSEFLFGG